MRSPILFAIALLLPACEGGDPSVTFGLEFRARYGDLPSQQTAELCEPPGRYHGNTSASSIDEWQIDEPPPHLFLETNPDGYDNVYRVRVYVASERDADGIWWKPSEVLAERVYDRQFGEGGATDSFMVDFEGQQYTVETRGIPPDATCL